MDYAFNFLETHKMMQEADYPYVGKVNPKAEQRCTSSKGFVQVSDYTDVPHNSASQLKAALQKQPVSVAIEADTSLFQLYKTGVITDSGCGTQLDHGVLAVGYGSEAEGEYFIVKNSWGPSWGDDGYVKIGTDDICGILQQPSYPAV